MYRGSLDSLLQTLNMNEHWRAIFGPVNRHLKDQELILRFLALRVAGDAYERPMTDFLNFFMHENRNAPDDLLDQMKSDFERSIEFAHLALGPTAFHPGRTLNAAAFDAVLIALSRRLQAAAPPAPDACRDAYAQLLEREDFQDAYLRATSDEASVRQRIALATAAFEGI